MKGQISIYDAIARAPRFNGADIDDSDVAGRFLSYLTPEPNTGCLLWTGAVRDSKSGYGNFYAGGGRAHKRTVYAHRFAWELAHGRILDGLTIDHRCRQPLCCNIDHLQLVTLEENSSLAADRLTHCPRGHVFDGLTTRIRPSGFRICVPCERIAARMARGIRDEAEATAAARRDWPELFAIAERRIEGIVVKRNRIDLLEAP